MTTFKFNSRIVFALLLVLSVLSGTPLRAQAPAKALATTDTKIPDAIQALSPSIVTVTRIKPEDEDSADKPVSHAGVVVDPRGYIVIPLLPSPSRPKLFTVRFADQKEVVGQLAAIDESLKFGVLKIERPEPVPAVSLAKSREARVDDRVTLVPSPASKELRGGRVTSTGITLGDEGSAKLMQTEITFPLSEYGSLMVSESGEPLGIFMAARTTPKPESIVLPLKALLPLITAAIDKPKDVPLVTVPASPPAVDLNKLLQISLEPATPLSKSLVERFGPHGAKVLDYEEGKRLKIEAPPLVLEEIGKAFKLAARENQKPEAKTAKPTKEPSTAEGVRVTGTPNESLPELVSKRLFNVRRKQAQPGGQRDGRTLAWVAVDPASPDVDHLKPGDVVDLVLPGDESFAVLDSDQTYVPKFKSVIEHVLVEQLQPPGNRRERGSSDVGLRLGIQITPTEIARIQSQPTYHDLSNSKISHFVKLKHSRAEHLVDLLRRSFSNVEYEADVERNALVLFWDPNLPIQGLMDAEAAIRKLDIPSTGLAVGSTTSRTLLDTPAAKQLVEQLAAQESAAAAEAATIRQLQANGQAESNQQPLAEHQRKLKNLLSTAFDLKLQLEELQVKELQSRLSRLERQIGQRKELREKIINRRAGELIEGDALRWDATAPALTKLPNSSVGNTKKAAKTATPAAVAILRERFGLLWDDLRSGKAKPDAVLRALNELAQAEPPEAHAQHVELLQGLLELVRRLQSTDSVSKAEVLEIEAAYEKARSLNDGASSKTSPLEPPEYVSVTPEADDIVVDLYGGSQVLPGLGKNPGYSKLLQSLNALKGVTTNIREAGKGDAIVMAIVRDPSQRCQREARQTQKESELRIAINSALKAAGIQATRWDEDAGAEEKSADEPAASNSRDERTFDGTPYSQGLKMLETERKPDKLATAMEARARLAATGDERRIARSLFVAAKLFESTDNTKERKLVWDAGTAALKRLPGEAVVAELLAALHDEQFQDAREFQCRFLISVATSPKSSVPDRLKAAFKLHDQELVTTLLKMVQPTEDRDPSSCIDFVLTAGPLVAEMLGELPDLEVKARLVEVPTKIVEGKFHDVTASPAQRGQVLRLLSKLRDRSTPAVPLLVTLLKSSDVEFAKPENKENKDTRRSLDDFTRERVILTLAAIGPPAKDSLPILEAELAVLDKQAKEDALLSGATGPRPRETIGSTPASVLRIAIGSIKGESRGALFQPRN